MHRHSSIHALWVSQDFIAFLYRPHTMLGLLSTVALLAYLAFGRPDASTDENICTGLVGCAVAFLLYCVLQLRCVALSPTVGECWRLPRSLTHPTVDCHPHGTRLARPCRRFAGYFVASPTRTVAHHELANSEARAT